MVIIDDLQEQYKDFMLYIWAKYHITPEISLKYIQFRQLGRRKARIFLDTYLKKIISLENRGELDEEQELIELRQQVIKDFNREFEKNPLPWTKVEGYHDE